MKNSLLVISFLFFSFYQKDKFDLKADMKRDNAILMEQHGVSIDKAGLSNFTPYTNIDLSKFKFNKQVSGRHHILKWTSITGAKLTIYEIKSIIPSDTVYRDKLLTVDSVVKTTNITLVEKVTLKPTNFIFHIFIIQPSTRKRLIYMTQEHEGLIQYRIGNNVFYSMRESVPLGIKYPDLKEIFKLIAAVK